MSVKNIILDLNTATGMTIQTAAVLIGKDGKYYLHALVDEAALLTAKEKVWTDSDGVKSYPATLTGAKGQKHTFAGMPIDDKINSNDFKVNEPVVIK